MLRYCCTSCREKSTYHYALVATGHLDWRSRYPTRHRLIVHPPAYAQQMERLLHLQYHQLQPHLSRTITHLLRQNKNRGFPVRRCIYPLYHHTTTGEILPHHHTLLHHSIQERFRDRPRSKRYQFLLHRQCQSSHQPGYDHRLPYLLRTIHQPRR